MNYTNSQNLWKEIDTNQKKESGWFAKLVPVLSSQKVYLAYEAKSLKKTLLIELNHNDLINFKEFKGNGFSIFFENISNTLKRVCIQLVDNQFEEVFFEITDLLIESIKDIKETDLLIKKILDRLTIYQSFFEKPRIGHSKNAEQGMFAELDFMENKLFNKIGINASLDLWKAPDSGLHDFTGKGNSIEIKSTNQIPSQNIRITSENQLNDKRINSLYLCVTEINRDVMGGMTLSEKILHIKEIIKNKNPDLLINFDTLLKKYGFFNFESKNYSTTFSVNMCYFYIVRDSFPRILPDSLNDGIKNVSYNINLNLCENWKTDEQTAMKELISVVPN